METTKNFEFQTPSGKTTIQVQVSETGVLLTGLDGSVFPFVNIPLAVWPEVFAFVSSVLRFRNLTADCSVMQLPTCYINAPDGFLVKGQDYGEPVVPLLVELTNGLRIILGADDRNDPVPPDLLVERFPRGWIAFFHPGQGADARCSLLILDDGSFSLYRDESHPSLGSWLPFEEATKALFGLTNP